MKLIWKYAKKYKKYIFVNLVTAMGFVLIEIGIPTLLKTGINSEFNNYDTHYILSLGLGMVGIALVGLVSLLILAYSTNRMVNGVIRDMRNEIFAKVQTYSHDEYEKFGISRLITNTGSDCFLIMQFLTMAVHTGMVAPLMILSSFIMIFIESKSLAFITLGAVPVMIGAIILINKNTKALSVQQQKGLDQLNLNMRESLTGLRVIRAFNNEQFQEQRFQDVNKNYGKVSRNMFRILTLTSPVFTLIFGGVMIMVVYLGAGKVTNNLLDFGTLTAFIEYVFHALFSFLMLANVFMMYPRTEVAAGRIGEILQEFPTVISKEQSVRETPTEGIVEFDQVSFAYSDNSEELVIRNVSFTARPGETVAFIGSTGSGKSTLIQLIPRFFDVTSGSIRIDGVDVKDYSLEALRKKIGYVPQRAVLFSGTIEENLRFGNENATMNDIEHAADVAQAKEFIERKQDRYQEILAEGGTNLSGGQKQRLCIARAVVRKPLIYIFDDSFSALDYKTDATLRSRLKEETQDATVLVVAQRVGTIMNADQILVMNEGEIVAAGTHKELLKSSEIYYEIASSQFSKEELEQ